MARFIVNKNAQPTGEHEVHNPDAYPACNRLPAPENQLFLGNFNSCHQAVTEARKHYANVDGCYYCSNECHSR